jgi:hypothetical protein
VRTTHNPRASPVAGCCCGVDVGPGIAKTGAFCEDNREVGASVCCKGSNAHSKASTYKQIIAITLFIKVDSW